MARINEYDAFLDITDIDVIFGYDASTGVTKGFSGKIIADLIRDVNDIQAVVNPDGSSLSDDLNQEILDRQAGDQANADALSSHVSDNVIHVTQADRDRWNAGVGSGMSQATYDPTGVLGDVFAMSNMVEGADAKILTSAERGNIAGAISHMANSDIHVTSSDKSHWNSKADGDHTHFGVYEPADPALQNHLSDNTRHITSQERSDLNEAMTLFYEEVSFNESIPFTNKLSIMSVVQTADINFSPDTVNSVDGYRTRVSVTGDGSHAINFSGFLKSGGSLDVDNSKQNSILFWKEGDLYFYRVYEVIDSSPATGAPDITVQNKAFPNAVGYGSDTRGAYAAGTTPTVLTVDTLDPGNFSTGTNRGTFMWACEQSGPRIIVFEVSGTIDYSGVDWRIQFETEAYCTVYGQTAPGHGITIKGASFFLQTTDLVFQHIRVLPGDVVTTVDQNSIDAIILYHGSSNIVFDHCTFGWSMDELVDSKDSVSNVTFSYCLFKEPLDKSWHYDEGTNFAERHSYGALMYGGEVTFYRNIFAYMSGRSPLVRQGGNHVINNLVYGSRWVGTMIESIGYDILLSCVGNHIVNLPYDGSKWGSGDYAVYVVNTLTTGSRIYLNDNICGITEADPGATVWDTVYNRQLATQAVTSPTDISEYDIMPASQVKSHLLANAGAFYWNRDAADAEVIQRMISGEDEWLRNSATDYPATARNLEGTATSGDMSAGHDWSSGNEDLIFNYNATPGGSIIPGSITLTANCANITEVVNHINSLLPSGLECAVIAGEAENPTVNVCIRTTHASDDSYLIISDTGTAHTTLGIPAQTFQGQSNISWDTTTVSEALSIPASPHDDPDSNSYSNIEEWAYGLGYEDEQGVVNSVEPWVFSGLTDDEMAAISGANTPSASNVFLTAADVGSISGYNIWQGTQAAYDGLGSYDPNTLYFIESA